LDTHTFLWFINGNPKLSNQVKARIEASENNRYLSIASLWEIAIKVNIGKLKLDLSFDDLFDKHIQDNAINLIDICPKHLDVLLTLPFHHKDPFDRLIIAQAIAENIIILSKDGMFGEYDIKRYW
jgi:PIN domain nuclease of toxin-antitoxin system